MTASLDELVALLALERLEENLFRGQSQDLGWGTVFGGQVLGQALSAATQTVPADRSAHSLHAYFLWPGDAGKPIVYDVDRIRDGRSFTTRRVVAIQSGRPIFNLSASFQMAEAGFEHQEPMPRTAPPHTLAVDANPLGNLPRRNDAPRRELPFDVRLVDAAPADLPPSAGAALPSAPQRLVWLKTAARLPDDPALHRELLAYISDYGFITSALTVHQVSPRTPGMQVASIDHVMWFHAPFRCDEWLLHVMDSPRARGGRGFVRGLVYTEDGTLVASTSQEGLIRQRTPKP